MVIAMRRKELIANAALLFCAMIWGANFIFQKQAAQYLGAFSFIAARYLVGALSLLPLIVITSSRRQQKAVAVDSGASDEQWHGKHFITAAALCSCANWGGSVLVQIGLHSTSASKAGFISSAYIALVPVIQLLFLKKKSSYRVWIGIIMAICGLYMLCISDVTGIERGDVAVMGSTICFAIHILLWSHVSPHVNGLHFVMTEFTCSALLAAIVAAFAETFQWSAIVQCIWPILFAGVLGVGLTYTIQIYSQRFTSSAIAALLMSMESVFSAVGSVLILHESLSIREWIGCIIMLATIVFIQCPLSQKHAKTHKVKPA
ncbi:MAG: DMT family transporter [Oscillibacter sp.]|nr:DMT family transporter [Oscillibacter sp.]